MLHLFVTTLVTTKYTGPNLPPVRHLKLPAFVLAFGLVWWALDAAKVLNPFVLPSPLRFVLAVLELGAGGELAHDLTQSLKRVGVGFLFAVIFGTPLGLALALVPTLRAFTEPPLHFLKPIPPIAWTPLAILAFGLGDGPAYGLTAVAAFFPIVFSVYSGARGIAIRHYELARVHGAGRWQTFTAITWPAVFPHVLQGYRLGLGFAWMAVVAAEMIAAGDGLGHLIESGQNLLRPEHVLVGMATIGLTGAAMDHALRCVERRWVRWR